MTKLVSQKDKAVPKQQTRLTSYSDRFFFVVFDRKGQPIDCLSFSEFTGSFFHATTTNDEKSAYERINVTNLLSLIEKNEIDTFNQQVKTANLPELLLLALVNPALKDALKKHVDSSHWLTLIKNNGLQHYWEQSVRSVNQLHPFDALLGKKLTSRDMRLLTTQKPKLVIESLLTLIRKENIQLFGQLIKKLATKIVIDLAYRSQALHQAIIGCADEDLLTYWEAKLLKYKINSLVSRHPFNSLAGNELFTMFHAQFTNTKHGIEFIRNLESILCFENFEAFKTVLSSELEPVINKSKTIDNKTIEKIILLAEQTTPLFGTPGHLLALETHLHLARYFAELNDDVKSGNHRKKVFEHLECAKKLEQASNSQQTMQTSYGTTYLAHAFKDCYAQISFSSIQFKDWESFTSLIKLYLNDTPERSRAPISG
jgi:Family of unknown function (DUF5630)